MSPFWQTFDANADNVDSVTIDGDLIDDAAVADEWVANATDCDLVTLSYEGDLYTIALENCAIGSFDGLATGYTDGEDLPAAAWIEVDSLWQPGQPQPAFLPR